MDTAYTYILLIASAAALVSHALCRRFWLACAIAAWAFPLGYLAVNGSRHPDLIAALIAWMPVIGGVGFVVGFPAAVAVGLPFLLARSLKAARRREGAPEQDGAWWRDHLRR